MSFKVPKSLMMKLLQGKSPEEIWDIYEGAEYDDGTPSPSPAPSPVAVDEVRANDRQSAASVGHSTRYADITEVCDWMTISRAALETPLDEKAIRHYIERGDITTYPAGNFTLIHRRELMSYHEHKVRRFDPDTEVFQRWLPESQVEQLVGRRIDYRRSKNQIAWYSPGSRLILVNLDECEKVFHD